MKTWMKSKQRKIDSIQRRKIGSFLWKNAKERLVLKMRTEYERFILKRKNERGKLELRTRIEKEKLEMKRTTDVIKGSQIKRNLIGSMLWL